MKLHLSHNTPQVVAAFMAAPRTMQGAIDPQVRRGALELSRDARRRAPAAFGTLRNSIIYRRLRAMDYQVSAGMNYATAVERGTGPGGSPPAQTLEDWIRVKGIAPRENTTIRGLAFLIGRKIRERGTPGQPFMQPAFDAMRPRIELLVGQGVTEGLRRVVRQ